MRLRWGLNCNQRKKQMNSRKMLELGMYRVNLKVLGLLFALYWSWFCPGYAAVTSI